MEEPSTQPTKQSAEAPSTPVVPTMEQKSSSNQTPLQLVLQWLTYAFWGWFLLACAWNVTLVIGMLVTTDTEVSGIIPYSLASLFVLLPIAAITDFIYHRNEPQQKNGGASAVMAIHAVIFALCTIGVFVFAIFSVIRLVTAIGDNDGIMTALISSFIMTLLYAVTFIRVVNPFKTKRIGRIYTITMIIVGIGIGIAAIVGPLTSSLRSRDDRAITTSLSTIGSGVDSYVSRNKKLPASLKEVQLNQAAQGVVNKNLVTIEQRVLDLKGPAEDEQSNQKWLGYRLCTKYTTEKEGSRFDDYSYNDTRNFEDSLYITAHKKGAVCYDQTASYMVAPLDPDPFEADPENMTR